MVFSSLIFLCIFLPAVLLVYYLVPGLRAKNTALTIFSLIFYAWGEPFWVLLLIACAAVGYLTGLVIGARRGTGAAKAALIISLVLNLGALAAFKYLNFFIGNLNSIFGLALPTSSLTLPIGISFFTFQTLSYSIDVYRGEVKVQRSFPDFLLFVSLFPQLIAGPILRYSEIAAQLDDRKATLEGFARGITRFICGLGKKVLLANYCNQIVEKLFSGGALSSLSVSSAWLGMVMYAFHIYFDFSGYSDMAIGLGRMFGFEYSENFRHPYISKNITEFWRRWHISLSSWFRDYVYIPLGGNRRGLPRQIFNMLIVWSLTGLWHGASWNFLLWGLWFFILLLIEKTVGAKRMDKVPRAVGMPVTFVLVVIGWVFFYFTDLSAGTAMLSRMFGGLGAPLWNEQTRLTLINSLPLLIVCIIGATPLLAAVGQSLEHNMRGRLVRPALYGIPTLLYNTAILALSIVSLVGGTENPFIYFRF